MPSLHRSIARLGALVLAAALVVGCAAAGNVTVVEVGSAAPPTLVPARTPVAEAEIDQDVVARYDVRDGALGRVVAGTDRSPYRRRYQRFADLLPAEVRSLVVGYIVFHPDDDSVAFVSAADDGNDTWILGLSDDVRDDRDLDATILHESAHLLTLGDDQLDTRWRGTCETFESIDGCLHLDAYLYDWVERYWVDLLDELAEIESARGRRADDLVERLYRDHRDRFVREYAATSPEEDFAETYSAWALGRAARSDAIDDKYQFFEQHEAFRSMKAYAVQAGAHR